MNGKQKILVVEDDEGIMLGIEENLKFAGYDVISAVDGNDGLRRATVDHPDLIVLDIMLPEMSGYEICRRLRDQGKQIPIIMLSARGEEFDKLHGFEMGADDYITKPFSVDELIARIKAVLARGTRAPQSGPKTYKFDDCVIDVESRTMTKGKKPVVLTRTEFDLLTYFWENEGKALSRDVVMNDVWGMEYYGTQRSLDSFVASLRRKIEKNSHKPKHILTVHGGGYKFVK